jgi:hypothetical protein
MQPFADALRAAGWEVEVLVDGSLQLYPQSGAESQAPPTPAAAASAGKPGSAPATPEDAFDWSPLRAHGWGVQTDDDGSTLLFPPASGAGKATAATEGIAGPPIEEQAPSKARTATAAPEIAGPAAQAEIAGEIDRLLAERGWRVGRSDDGSLLLYPLGRVDVSAAAIEPSAGVLPEAVRERQVSLPVDGWGEARAVAQSWLDSVKDPTLRLGKVRRIFQVYLVSIVDASPPHRLRHQIAVSVEDGRVVVLN